MFWTDEATAPTTGGGGDVGPGDCPPPVELTGIASAVAAPLGRTIDQLRQAGRDSAAENQAAFREAQQRSAVDAPSAQVIPDAGVQRPAIGPAQPQGQTPAPAQYSPDGLFWWDGSRWLPIPGKHRYGHASRVLYCALWAFWTVALTLGGFAAIRSGFSALSGSTDTTSLATSLGTTAASTQGSGPGSIVIGLILLGLAGLAGRYDYRIWTWQARRLLFFIIF